MARTLLFSAVVLSITLWGCAAQPPRMLTEATCQSTSCKIKIDASACDSGGVPSVDIDKIHVKGNHNVQLVWEVQHARWELRLGKSILLKDPTGDPTGQFSDKLLLGNNDQPDPNLKKGKKMQWKDANILVDVNEFAYKIILFDSNDRTCTLDPLINNDG